MSFRLFIYYCALCGGWAALGGWILGRNIYPAHNDLGQQDGIRAMFLGMMVALGLGTVDALWNLSLRQFLSIFVRVAVAVVIGAVGGLVGGLVANRFNVTEDVFFVVGWTLTGLLVGASIGSYEVIASLVRQQDIRSARKKLIKCLIGGTAGGVVGGGLALFMKIGWAKVFRGKHPEDLWSPSAMGFVALGMCIGLLVGLAQVILKEAWIKVEAGFRRGREMILAKQRTTIGRAEVCDVGLFGDNTVEKLHASILLEGNRYFIEDAHTPAGTFVNDQRVAGRAPLNSGDLIRVGRSLLRFREKRR
jgi:hypothetical protein